MPPANPNRTTISFIGFQQINRLARLLCFLFVIIFFKASAQQDTSMVYIKNGSYIPLYGSTSKQAISVSDFYLDKYAVTNEQYLLFIKTHFDYRKSKIKLIFSEKNYLDYWINDTSYSPFNPSAPVTNVSWFASRYYCECQGKRLPTMDEWEYVAMADRTDSDARTKIEFTKNILSWYEKPNTFLNPVGATFKNYWGVYDMHGLIWEWTSDFNSIFLSAGAGKDNDTDKILYCGSGSVNASDLMDYAAFMRYAFRGSLKANYTTRNLGFRCAQDSFKNLLLKK